MPAAGPARPIREREINQDRQYVALFDQFLNSGETLDTLLDLYGSEIIDRSLRFGIDHMQRVIACAETCLPQDRMVTYRGMVKKLRGE